MFKKWFYRGFKKDEKVEKVEKDYKYTPLTMSSMKDYSKYRENNPHQLFCYVPFNSLSFSFSGRVLACVYNQKVELGTYPKNSIREMWFNSKMGNELREHLSHNDLSYGCEHCKYFVEHGKFSGLKPLVYDKYKDITPGQYPKVIEFELSNTCNFECVMCNGFVSSSIRKNRDQLPAIIHPYDDDFVEQLKEFIPHLEEAKFYGGEPFLIPIYFKIWAEIVRLKPSIKIFTITNGSTLNEKIKDLIENGNFDIGVSLDSLDKNRLESIRKNADFDTLMKNIEYYNDYCKKRGKSLVISFTMMRINYMDFYEVIQFCNRIDARIYVSYLKTPPQFGIWNLPSETLDEIREECLQKRLPDKTANNRFNKKVFNDFIIYLKNTAIENQNRDSKQIIPLGNKIIPKRIEIIEAYQATVNYQEKCKIHLKDNPQLYDKVYNALLNYQDEKLVNKIFYQMFNTPKDILIKELEKMNNEDIVKQIQKSMNLQ
ncbi:MAG: twitch domain-containing radical SAM protein [Chitinophagales bacterium]|nr:twitch domain-containing radical SAM protein [Chitinophagales bacterium]